MIKINYENLGKQIKKYRKQKKYSQSDLAEKIDKSVQHISKIERGISKASLQTLVDITNALDISMDELLNMSVKKSSDNFLNKDFINIFSDCSLKERTFLMENLLFFKSQLKKIKNTDNENSIKQI
ncbi:helix-turn-helix transcriptional regulator [Anaerofustis stercorihominis]|uniref:DNA-binding helix-turn-helix protein n=1 Tax=Anaerofustis stercorihominis DSM 17244 TaxID=445971 RepID=B1CAW2_9FIRM|nr:helix-turn-helix transcriptional regulator [Anaerofustis stercorihominis]EDS71409.1 DNA-binding helix-turn-helix protein [Anaerofustis stercorihominis DSM 17244]MCQ4795361.1 helix-turn-helix transcriptional regulator [Anaerofustis stercorihominis]